MLILSYTAKDINVNEQRNFPHTKAKQKVRYYK